MNMQSGNEAQVPMPIILDEESMVSGRPFFGSVHFMMKQGQSVIADAGSLLYFDSSLQMETDCIGGFMKSCARSCAGESFCFNKYTKISEGQGMLGLSFLLPGDIVPLVCYQDMGWMLSKGAFVCASENIMVGLSCSLCNSIQGSMAGESMFYTKVTMIDAGAQEAGLFYAGGFGAIQKHVVAAGECLYVDNGMFFAGPTYTKIRIMMYGGLKQCCLGGEGIVMRFPGPCTILTQNRDPSLFLPPPGSDSPAEGATQ